MEECWLPWSFNLPNDMNEWKEEFNKFVASFKESINNILNVIDFLEEHMKIALKNWKDRINITKRKEKLENCNNEH